MQTFIGRLASKAILDHSKSLEDLTIVLPNRRSIVFLKAEFKKQLEQSSWLPNFYSIEDFVQELGAYQQIDQLDLVFELYVTHQLIEGSKAEPFSEFITWAPTLLQDFNEIDRYLVEAKELFGFISEAKALETWNVEGQELSSFQQQYLKFWKSLYSYYTHFNNQLEKEKRVYQGKGFRKVAESIHNLNTEQFGKVYFAGFNALTNAEEEIIDFFIKEKGAEIFWDADEYYLEDGYQEAGNFLRKHRKKWGNKFSWISDNLLNEEKEVSIYGVAGNIGQAKLVGNLIERSGTDTNKAVILSDESLLLPVLESIPGQFDAINVTMGYPLSLSIFYNWFESYILLFRRATEWKKDAPESTITGIYYKEVNAFFKNTVFEFLSNDKRKYILDFLSQLKQEQLIFINRDRFNSIQEHLGVAFFKLSNNPSHSVIDYCLQLIELIKNDGKETISAIEKECLFTFYKCFNRLKELNDRVKENIDLETLYQVFKQLCSKESIDFVGEPLGGLQVMGVLESRTLDFKEVIITSVNEGVLPSGKTQNSFIPFDVKRKFGLPIYKEKDAIFSYHFYRLLQRAKKITIIYNSKVSQLQGGEMSRFIKQLLHELPFKNKRAEVKLESFSPLLLRSDKRKVGIPKSKNIIDAIQTHIESGLSPSAINTFLNCELDYYYKYILGLREEEAVEEKVESNTFGTIVHNSVERLYQPFLGKILDDVIIQKIKTEVDQELIFQFKKELGIIPEYGNHKLTYEIARVFINNLILFDKKQIDLGNEIQLLKVEESFKSSFDIPYDSGLQAVVLKGKVDRVDRMNGKLRIIDYKTGGVQLSDLSFQNVDVLLSGRKDKAVQMLIYKLAYQRANSKEEVTAGIVSLKNISSGFVPLKFEYSGEKEEEFLSNLLNRLFEVDKTLVHQAGARFCQFCE